MSKTAKSMFCLRCLCLLLFLTQSLSWNARWIARPCLMATSRLASQQQQQQQQQQHLNNSNHPDEKHEPRRRDVLRKILGSTNGILVMVASTLTHTTRSGCQAALTTTAGGEGAQRMVLTQKPRAPVGALLPAMQQRLLLEACRALLAKQLSTTTTTVTSVKTKTELLQKLQSIIPPLVDENGSTPFRLSTTSTRNQDLDLLQKYPPNQTLQGRVVRAAMNVYTDNLQYGQDPQYTVTDDTWKRQYIRANNGLPDVKSVVAADLDVRDLYRNQVQQLLDDAAAELYLVASAWASSESLSTPDNLQELQAILQQAAQAFDLWLDRIADDDVQQALQAALEGKSLRVVDSYYSGFVPPPPPFPST